MSSFGYILLLSICTSVSIAFKLQNQPTDFKHNDISGDAENNCPSLFLTPLIKTGEIEKAQNLSRVHLDDTKSVESYSGFLTVDERCASNMFFWYFPSERNNSGDPVVVWLQGGPGISSLYGAMEEIGPFYLYNGTLKKRLYHWSDKRNVLFIDSPVGTGYSYTNVFRPSCYSANQDDIRANLYEALTQFYRLFPALQKNELFLFGESYAGKYVAGLAYSIHKKNKKSHIKINLKGLGIGNGFVDPANMLNYTRLMYNVGVLPEPFVQWGQSELQDPVLVAIGNNDYKTANNQYDLLLQIVLDQCTKLDHNNFIKPAIEKSDKINIKEFINYFRTPYVMCGLHVADANNVFTNEDTDVTKHLILDYLRSVKPWIELLLEHYPIMFYNGQLDILGGAALTQNVLKKLLWSGTEEFQKVQQIPIINGSVIAWGTEYGNLREYRIRNAGPEVPKDQPKAMYYIMEKFIQSATQKENIKVAS